MLMKASKTHASPDSQSNVNRYYYRLLHKTTTNALGLMLASLRGSKQDLLTCSEVLNVTIIEITE